MINCFILLTSHGLIGKESLGQQVTIRDGTRSTNATTYYYTSLNMPGATFYIVTQGWEDGDYTTTTYNGYSCFKFVKDDKIVYVRTTAFYPNTSATYDQSNKYPSDSTISTNVTNYLNNGNSAFYYSGKWRIFNADGLQYVQLAVYGTQAFKFEEDEIVLQHKAITSSGPMALSNLAAPKYPTLKLEITNTGSGRRYLGGYYVTVSCVPNEDNGISNSVFIKTHEREDDSHENYSGYRQEDHHRSVELHRKAGRNQSHGQGIRRP